MGTDGAEEHLSEEHPGDRGDPDYTEGGAVHGFDTQCVQSGHAPSAHDTPPIAPPIYQASVFETPDLDTLERAMAREDGHYIYTRAGNPTVDALIEAVVSLEGAESGEVAASGMGAISAVLLGHLGSGDKLYTTSQLYGNTRHLTDRHLPGLGIQAVHMTEQQIVSEGLPKDAKVLYAEPVSNPLLVVADLPRLADAAHDAGALFVVDNTFATPYHCRPLEHGADIVVHSATKYLGGHGDIILGVAVGTSAAMRPVGPTLRTLGMSAPPLEAWLALRGTRTLHLRMARHAENASTIAAELATRRDVSRVYYPGLSDHRTHDVALRMLERGFGGVVSFELAGSLPAARAFVESLELVRIAGSLADVCSTVSIPALTSHRLLPAEVRTSMGVEDGLVRLSVGVEDSNDILSDVTSALDRSTCAS